MWRGSGHEGKRRFGLLKSVKQASDMADPIRTGTGAPSCGRSVGRPGPWAATVTGGCGIGRTPPAARSRPRRTGRGGRPSKPVPGRRSASGGMRETRRVGLFLWEGSRRTGPDLACRLTGGRRPGPRPAPAQDRDYVSQLRSRSFERDHRRINSTPRSSFGDKARSESRLLAAPPLSG